jgi:hypothetical protein
MDYDTKTPNGGGRGGFRAGGTVIWVIDCLAGIIVFGGRPVEWDGGLTVFVVKAQRLTNGLRGGSHVVLTHPF